MKLLKFIFLLCITVSITSCNDSSSDETEIPLNLSNKNIAGTYNINSIIINTKVTSVTEVSGVSVPYNIASSISTGDTFQFAFTLNSNGTYTASGQYRIVSTITPEVGKEVTNLEIISSTDSGTFALNSVDAKITFTSSTTGFLSGTFHILIFNETTLSLNQEIAEVEDAITREIKTNISFIRAQ